LGGAEFFTEGKGATVDEAFRQAREEAEYDHGHSGYTGTVAEKTEFVLIPDSEWKGKYDPMWYAGKLMRDDDSRIDDKWGPAGAIQLDKGRWLFFGRAST